MKKICILTLHIFLVSAIFIVPKIYAAEITTLPETIIQGDPILVTITATTSPTKILFDNQNIPIFTYLGKPHGLIPIDINQKVGTHQIRVIFAKSTTTRELTILAREKIEAPLGIPEKLGGNTPVAQKSLVSNLTKENATLVNLKTGTKAFWTAGFRSPLAVLTVTDPYGYNRKTGEYTIAHKGTDFRAVEGTKVYAMNRGVVRVAHTYTVYGKTIIVDHGFGLNTMYMHLSKIYVNEGQLVQRGEIIGLSGKTGYADIPHLHVSIKINNVSVDPVTFMKFFGVI